MAKIVVNKNFQSKYLYRAYERLIKPDYSINNCFVSNWDGSNTNLYLYDMSKKGTITYYNDLSSVYKSTWSGIGMEFDGNWTPNDNVQKIPHQYFLCDETFITLLNKINKLIKDGMTVLPKVVNSTSVTAVTDINKTANISIVMLYASLFNADKNVRNNTIDYFVSSNIISISDGNIIKSILTTFNLVDLNVMLNSYGGIYVPKVEDFSSILNGTNIDILINKTLRLDNPYNKVIDNPINSQLYILVIPYVDSKMTDGLTNKVLRWGAPATNLNTLTSDGRNNLVNVEFNTGKCLVGYNCFHRKDTNTVVNQIPYIALSLTETGLGGDIEYDHLDEIEYLDEIKVTIALPKEYI